MTSAGTSATDTLHSIYDKATTALGYGATQEQEVQGEQDREEQGNGEKKKKEQAGYIEGPGNHPDSSKELNSTNQDHDHSEYKNKLSVNEETETNIDEANASVGERRLPQDGKGADVEDGERRNRKTKSGDQKDALERALGDEGPAGDLTGAKLGRDLESDAYAKKIAERSNESSKGINESTTSAVAGASVGEPIQSDRNNAELVKERKKGKGADDNVGQDSEDDEEVKRQAKEAATEQNPHQKGPKWASRPNEEQREKLRQQTEEKRKKDKEARESGGNNSLRQWAKNRLGSRRESRFDENVGQEDEEASAQVNGIDLLRDPKDNEEQSGEKSSSSPPENTDQSRPKSQNRLSSMFGGGGAAATTSSASTNKDGRGKSFRQDDTKEGSEGPEETGKPKTASRNNSSAPSGSQQAKMARISKLMLGGQKDHEVGGSSSPRESEEGDHTARGIDGVPLPTGNTNASARWGALRKRLKENSARRAKGGDQKARVVGQMSVVTELQTGILPVFMLKMSLERDEQGNRRIPVLLNHLRLRISDSVNVLNNSSAVFRIELEYGDGLVRWVCYRSLRDFVNLHTHYRAAAIKGYLGRPVGANEGDFGLPSFPKTSLPYFNQLQRQGRTKGSSNVKADFAKAQRKALEDYIIEMIKRTMFRPEANRLCKFFEISALSISLAARGGFQGKQGYLRILSKSSRKDAQKGILTPVSWIKSHEPKWFIVRESYIVIVDEPDSLQVHDVFLVDGAFEIERPKRLYKQTIHLAHDLGRDKAGDDNKGEEKNNKAQKEAENEKNNTEEEAIEDSKKDKSHPSKVTKKLTGDLQDKDNTAILTDGQFRDRQDELEESGAKRPKDGPNANVSSHTFYIKNAERKLKLVAKNERQMDQFIASMERVARRNIFSKSNRFGSFAPIRLNCNAQWLVDGRDYFWQVSRALMRAKDRIFIHDWWLSPELYLRRPGTPKYRLDNILKKKAEEGVKIFVIVYNEVSNNFTPTDSNYTKQRLIGLHRNIYVQRSPSHFQTGTFYWAHHEKLCVIDETIAFMGGLDLCFGRWDTSAHLLTDNHTNDIADEDKDAMPQHDATLLGPGVKGKEFYVWPGQDFANERVIEWHDLTKPENDLFDRETHPRMPWHDIGLQLIGQPARDLCRHFTQRWNYLLRIKNHKRLMPFLVPPPDFQPHELQKYDLTGTCEAQICRSAGPWSLGTASTVEHSIQNAYLKAIQMSEHFVYIENQFFVTSTETRGTVIENLIGEALVSRIIRAHREQTKWKAVIVIPLIPGFPMPIDHQDASSVRLIVELQNRSICRGENSIFGKLRRHGIDPDDYIVFCSLRQWGKLPSGQLTTEQVYIHAKAMIVDDRLVLIGSANINERSQRGDRDSELACVVRDTDLIDSTMGGEPFKVGRFAHTLRVRLMKEHLGLDVDELEKDAAILQDVRPEKMLDEDDHWDPDNEQSRLDADETSGKTKVHARNLFGNFTDSFKEAAGPMKDGAGKEAKAEIAKYNPLSKINRREMANGGGDGENGQDAVKQESSEHYAQPLQERIDEVIDSPDQGQEKGSENTVMPTIEEKLMADGTIPPTANGSNGHGHYNGDATKEDMKKSLSGKMSINPWQPPAHSPNIDADMFADPLNDRFFKDMWMASAVHNTQIFRKVFKSVPDDTVTTWAEYKAFNAWAERLAKSSIKTNSAAQKVNEESGPTRENEDGDVSPEKSAGEPGATINKSGHTANHSNPSNTLPKSIPRPPNVDEGFTQKELEQMEALLEETRGTLVLHCTRFLEAEDRSDNLLFPMDKINPLNVYD